MVYSRVNVVPGEKTEQCTAVTNSVWYVFCWIMLITDGFMSLGNVEGVKNRALIISPCDKVKAKQKKWHEYWVAI